MIGRHRPWIGVLFGTLGAGIMVAFSACGREQEKGKTSPVTPPPVRITAYINVSSGCQEPTIELLKSFPKTYPGRVRVDIVDFGDQGAGNKRWKESGYDCMIIEINGSPLVKFDSGGKPKTVALRQPVGFWWTQEDLKAAVAAAVNGTLQRGTEEEAIAGQPSRKIKAKVVVEEVRREGKTWARVLINERPAMLIRVGAEGKSAVQRAEVAAQTIREWLKNPVKPNEIDRQAAKGGWVVRVNKKVVALATEADAKAMGGTAEQVAKKWLVGIRQGIAIAARPPDAQAAAQKEPQEEGCETGG